MALSGSIINADGTPSTYFILQDLHIWTTANTVDVTLLGYYNKASYQSGCTANYTLLITFTFAQLGATTDVTQAEVYTNLQTLSQFSGSQIVS